MLKSFYKIALATLTTIVTALALISIIVSISGSRNSNSNGAANTNTFTSLADFSDKKIASEYGSVFPKFIDRIIPNVEHSHYMTFNALVAALDDGAVDAIALDMPVALYLAAHDTDFAVFPYVISVDTYGFAVPKGSRLFEDGNRVLRRLKESGVIDDAEMYWFAADSGEEKAVPRLTHIPGFDGSAGTIRFGCETTLTPMSYAAPDGTPIGFDIDILNRIAYELNMKVEVVQMPFGNLLPSLLAGRIDMAGGSMTITEERKETVDFIGPYFEGGTALVVKRSSMPVNHTSSSS
ncbi:amino acid ABC transporter substrate-binding protein [Fibrobacteres bacterium R8-0-B4]